MAAIDVHSYWLAAVIGLGFTHYALSFYYARSRITALATNPASALPVLSLGGLFCVVYFLEFPLEVYFGIHHAFNEAYLKRYGEKSGAAQESMAPYRCLLHLAAYFCVLRNDTHLSQFPAGLLWGFIAVSCVLYGLKAKASQVDRRFNALVTDHCVEVSLLVAVAVSCFVEINFLQVVMYHFVLWTLLPLPMMRRRGGGHLEQYLLLTGATLALIFGALLLVPAGKLSAVLVVALSQFYLWSYLHISASMALSSAHPNWIVKLFALPERSVRG